MDVVAIAGATYPRMKSLLLDPCATALDQNDQHDHEQYASNNLDYRGSVHVKSPFLFLFEQSLK